MKMTRGLIFSIAVLLLAAPLLRAQDYSRYRAFSLGTSLATVLKHTDQRAPDVKVIHPQPTLIQELTWWPPAIPGATHRPDPVEQMQFSFFNGMLYKITVTYDRTATEGLTADDMVKSISTKYGPATTVTPEIDSTKSDPYEVEQMPVATWEDAQNSFNLVRSAYSHGFELVVISKSVNVRAEANLTEALKIDKQEAPQKEADRLKKQTDDLEAARLKNMKVFQP